MTNPDEVPTDALLHISRRNIRICGFHSNKRIISTLFDLLLDDWNNLLPSLTKDGKPKPTKLDGCHVRKAMYQNNWIQAVDIMDKEIKTVEVWQVKFEITIFNTN